MRQGNALSQSRRTIRTSFQSTLIVLLHIFTGRRDVWGKCTSEADMIWLKLQVSWRGSCHVWAINNMRSWKNIRHFHLKENLALFSFLESDDVMTLLLPKWSMSKVRTFGHRHCMPFLYYLASIWILPHPSLSLVSLKHVFFIYCYTIFPPCGVATKHYIYLLLLWLLFRILESFVAYQSKSFPRLLYMSGSEHVTMVVMVFVVVIVFVVVVVGGTICCRLAATFPPIVPNSGCSRGFDEATTTRVN